MKQRRYLLLFTLLAPVGCALSPQLVNINPVVRISPEQVTTTNASLALAVVDRRESRVLGKRGDGEASNISTSGDITGPLRIALAELLTEMGYRITSDRSVPALRVEVAALGYNVQDNRVTKNIETHASINAIYSKGGITYTNNYKATRSRQVLTAPTAGENEKLINETLGAVLEQLLDDSKLFTFIRSG